ncbi:amino acid adenylation domain-containing protein, partial [Bacillus sp. AP50]
GRPKGCQISHRNVIKTIKNNGYIEITTDDRFLQLLNYAFDGSVFDIYSALLNGARLVLAPNKAASDLKEIARLMKEENITISLMTTALFNVIVDEQISCLKNLRKVLMGGEKASIKHVRKAVNYLGDNRIINVYGPTETTVFAATYEADHQINSLDCIPIGRSINNTQLYVVSQSGHLQPMGVSGELYIGGDGVGKGYLNQSELTNKFFIDNPFGEGKVYKTGDLVRWLPNGNLEYLGRSDQQVKLRGHRIELSEIEARLAEYPGIQNCVVALKGEGSNGSYLYAYYVAELKVETVALKKFLQEKLPSFMIPARFVQLDEIPLTSNGKVDKGSLPEIQEIHDPRHQKATTQLEQQLVVLYQEVLNREKIGIYDNFFELGGHSLKLMMLTSRISKELAVDISFRDVYANQTVKQLADHINSLEKNIFEAINPALESEFYPVSYAQKRMYLVQEIEGDNSTHYNMPIALEIKGALQKTKVETIMQLLVDRHESLRTSFHIKDEQIVQKIHQRVDFQFEIISSSGRDESVLVEQFVRPFNLQSGSLFRAALIEKSSEDFILCLDMHHIISDGVSANILFQEFVSLYRNEKLPELSVQYKDYSVWQQREDQKQKIQEQEAFWLNRFTGEIPVLNMPSDFPERADKLSKGETFHTEINATLLEKLRDLSIRSGTTLFTTLLASFHIFLSKYTSQEDIVVGTPISGRGHTDLERIVGMFVNTLAIRLQSNSSLTFNEFLAKVKNETVLAFDHAEYPFEMLVEKLNLYRNSGSNPLIHTIFTLQSESSSADGIPDLTVTPYEWEWGNSKYDFTLAATEGESLRISVEYNTGKFKRSTIKRMLKHFEWILEQITKNPDMLLKSIEIATPHEKDMVLEQFNSTYKHIPTNKTIHQLFEEQAEKAPGYPAVIYKDEVLTYGELNNQSNKLAKMLRKAGVGPETVVGVIMNPSLEMVVSTLAILKSGGAFLPIDPKLPVGRQVYMLEDSSADHLVVHTLNQIPESYGGNTFCLEQLSSSNEDEPNLESIIKPDNLAYVIYTSGTTGRPKGVMVEHLSLVNLCFWHNHEFQVIPKDRSAKLAGFGFDASVWEVFPYLIAGSSIYIVEDDIRGDAVALNSYFEKNEITISFLPTQLAEQFIPLNNSSLRILLIGGEKVRKVSSAPYRIVNNYGPTENTVVATSCTLFENQMEYPIGQPIWNNQILILSPDGNVQPVGIPGELYIAGRGLARGYMNNPSLTEERFVENPYSDGKMYSTGDVARWLPDGKIEFLGRQDNQVKIRGFRIEINEIESCLLQYPSIREAVVLAHESESKRYYLCAYIVSSNKADYSEIRRFLLEQLPEYMVPAHVIQLDHIPLNPNGKIDKKKLLEVKEFTLPVSKYTAPSNPLEKKLVAIFKDVLKVEQIGVHDNFFERGGHSLNATILLSRIHKQLNIGIKLREFFANPTVSGTAQLMRQEKNTRYLSIQKAAERPSYPASAAQKRMFIVEQLDAQNDGTNYNMPIVMEAKGNLSAENVEKAFKSLIARHEALRTSFHLEDNHLTQVIHHQDIPWSLDVVRASESEIENLVNKFIVPFDLQKAPLFRAVLLEISPNRQLIMMDMHHIIADGISANILLRDFCALYQGHSLPNITLNYKDFAVWQQEDEQIEKLKTDEEYWLNMLSGELPVLDLPTDFTRPPVRQFKGETLEFSVDSSILKKLKELSASEGATLYMTLLAAYNVLLSKYTEKEDIIVGSPIAGRPHADLEEVVGVFINVLALRNRPEGSLSFREFLANVRTETLKSYEYSNYPFEELVEKLDLKRDFSRNPIFDTTFSLQNFDLDIAIGEELQFKPYEIEWKSSKFDLSWICQEGESLYITLEYSTSLFTQDTIERMRNHFLHLLYQIVEDPEQKLSDMILVTEEEKHQLLYTFNQTEKPFPNDKAIHQLFEEQ